MLLFVEDVKKGERCNAEAERCNAEAESFASKGKFEFLFICRGLLPEIICS
jgi:hypothetical protein